MWCVVCVCCCGIAKCACVFVCGSFVYAWCDVCVEGRGAGTPHRRGKGRESKAPALTFDYLFSTPESKTATIDELVLAEMEACDMEILVATDAVFGSIFAHVVLKKGVEEDR